MTKPAPASHSTHSDPSTVVAQLSVILGNTYVLAVKTHGAHWNVKGPGFFRLHAAFDEQYHELLVAADELAERIRALDAPAPASMRQLLEHSSLNEPVVGDDMVMVRALRDDHRSVSTLIHAAIAIAHAAKDEGTVDLLVGRSKAHEKTAWMLTATLGG